MYLQIRDGANKLFCGVGLGASGNFQFKNRNGTWSDSGVPYTTNVWQRLILTLNFATETFSLFEKSTPIAVDKPFATNQTMSFIPVSIYVQGPVNNPGSCYVDAIKAEFLQDGSGLQNAINSNLSLGRYDLASNCTYDVSYPLALPSNFTLNGSGSTLRMSPFSQNALLLNANWSGDSNITVSNLVVDGNAYDQLIDPSNNATTRYQANNATNLDNQGIYFKGVEGVQISDVTFSGIPNEALMLISCNSATVAECLFTNCALLTVSNNMSQAALYTRWTTHSRIVNNQFFNCYEGGLANGTGSDYNFISGNYSTNSAGGEGVFLGQSSFCVAVGNTILNSSYLGDPLNFPSSNQKYWGSGAGIACDGIGNASLQISNTICFNYIWNIGSAGITSASAVGTRIYGNQIFSANFTNQANPSGAISLYASTNVLVENNVIQSNNCAAVGVSASKNCTITNNLVGPANDLNGVYLNSSTGINTNNNLTDVQPITGGGGSGIVLDNTNSIGVTISGSWIFSTSTAGYVGNGYLHDNNTGATGGKSVRFSPTLPTGGTYAVYGTWTSTANRASNAPVDLILRGGTNTLSLNQQSNGGQWNWLGNYNFASGNQGGVLIRNDGASGFVIVDAVRFALLVSQPTAPTELTAQAGNQRADLSWASMPTASNFIIRRSLNSGGPFTVIGSSLLNAFVDSTAANGTTYYYKVSAVNPGGESDDSVTVSATPACGSLVPEGLSVVASETNNQVTLEWNTPTGAEASQIAFFKVKRSLAIGGPFSVLTNSTIAKFVDVAVSAGSNYFYVVSAVNPCGIEGANSDVVAAKPGIVVDNSDTPKISLTGSWTTSANPGDYGINYFHDGNAGSGKAVRFTPNLPVSGPYDVYVWWVASSNRATNAPIDIFFNSGTNTLYVNQTVKGSRWNYLGQFSFNSGSSGGIRIRDDGASGYVIADAVQWVWNTNATNMSSNSQVQPPNTGTEGPALFAREASDHRLNLGWAADAVGFQLQSSADLRNEGWNTMMTVSNGPSFIILPMTNEMMFYRLLSPQ
jgi:parallel beta-helix repeat protein